jgi:hypothetical protein
LFLAEEIVAIIIKKKRKKKGIEAWNMPWLMKVRDGNNILISRYMN